MKRDKAQFEQWVRQYAGDLYRYAYWLTRDHGIAEDLVQEAFGRAWKYFGTLQKPEQAKSWLITIVKRENARRFEKKRVQTVDEPLENIPDENNDDPRVESLREHLKALDKDYKEPLVMQALMGFSCEDIAAELKLTKAAVMTRLYRARKMLKTQFEAEDHDEQASERAKPRGPK